MIIFFFVLWQSYNNNSYYGNDPQKNFDLVDLEPLRWWKLEIVAIWALLYRGCT